MSGMVSLFGFGPDFLDDTELIKAYDRARRLCKSNANDSESTAEIVTDPPGQWTKVSMEQNSKPMNSILNLNDYSLSTSGRGTYSNSTWNVGGYCRAIYDDDGLYYEAEIVEIGSDNSYALIRFLGYENEQEVQLSDLSKSLGRKARRAQIHLAAEFAKANAVGAEDDITEQTLDPSFMNLKLGNELGTDHQSDHKTSKLVTQGTQVASSSLPHECSSKSPLEMDWTKAFPNIFMPPMPSSLAGVGFEKGEIPSLLMTWYMSGYQAGYYDAKRDLKSSI